MADNIVRIVADRFGVTSDNRAVDLATLQPVVLKIFDTADDQRQAQWLSRCDRFHRVRHPCFAVLLDYGMLGTSRRFEAWQGGPVWRGGTARLERTIRDAGRFLAASHLTGFDASGGTVYESRHGPVLVPDQACGFAVSMPRVNSHQYSRGEPANCGIEGVNRAVDAVLSDLVASVSGPRPYLVCVWGPRGSGRTTTVVRASRAARLRGFVPIAQQGLAIVDRRLLKDRQVCLFSGAPHSWMSALLTLSRASARAHVVVQVALTETTGMRGIGLEPLSARTLVASVTPEVFRDSSARSIRQLATRARGMPGRFAQLLWGQPQSTDRLSLSSNGDGRTSRSRGRVAEQQATYGPSAARPADECVQGDRSPACEWPAPAEVFALRRRAAVAADLLRRGRHAPGVRQLRQAVGALVRRNDRAHAAESMVVLASALLARGQTRGAQAVLEQAHACAERGGIDHTLVDVAVLSSHAWTDLMRPDEAENAAASALAVARRLADESRAAAARIAMSRCLFWKGRYSESLSALVAPGDAGELAPALVVGAKSAAARAMIGLGDLVQAGECARQAEDEAGRSADPRLLGRAHRALALVHLALGDVGALRHDVARALAQARAARDPLSAFRARLLQAELERRTQGRSSSARYVRLASRIAATHLPPMLRARLDVTHELARCGDDAAGVVARHANRTGLVALTVYAGLTGEARSSPLSRVACDIAGILDLCQTAEDETRVLLELCRRVREQSHAAGVAVFVREGSSTVPVAHDGIKPDAEIAMRAIDGAVPMPPHQLRERLEAAAPVRYGSTVIGALAARWTVGTLYDLSHAGDVLTLAATAAAPLVSGALANLTDRTVPTSTDLLGATPAIVELRRAIERAAKAPFAVLIEGESGVGKELVAKAIHRQGFKRDRPFSTLNCAALPDDLVEAELFGHARGAFTGAINERAGVFEEAHGGTLLLDEVGELSLRAQAKLLRVIQEGELRRIGENHARRVDVRIVAATNRDLRHEVAAGRFRLDLLYRLDVIRLVVPPLRERREDIALLAERFWRDAVGKIGSRAVLARGTLAALARYDWPGNVRELQNVLAALAVRTPRRGVVPEVALPPQFEAARRAEGCRLDDARRVFEERFVRAALVRSGGHRARAAAELGVTRQGLTKLMTRLGI